MGDSLKEIDEALIQLEKMEQAVEPEISLFVPALAPFLGLFKAVIGGVDMIAHATGHGAAESIQEATNHNTRGAPNSPILGPDRPPGG